MPSACAAIGCSNRCDADAKQRGITFHKVPRDLERREAWKKALRRDFVPTNHTVVCSCHFEEKDMDRTGQTVRLREGVTPSVFNFPKMPRRSKRSSASKSSKKHKPPETKTNKYSKKVFLPEEPVSPEPQTAPAAAGVQKARKSIRGSSRLVVNVKDSPAVTVALEPQPPEPPTPPAPNPSAEDHHYAIDPENVKQKLEEAQARIEDLQKQLRNYRDRERRKDALLSALLEELKRQSTLTNELMESSELWVLCDSCGSKEPEFQCPTEAPEYDER